MKYQITFIILLFIQSCAFLPTGPVEAVLIEDSKYNGVEYKYQLKLKTRESSGSHSFLVFLFSTPHDESSVIYLNSIDGKVYIDSIKAIAQSYEDFRYLNKGYIEFKGSKVIINLQYTFPDSTPVDQFQYNGEYEIVNVR